MMREIGFLAVTPDTHEATTPEGVAAFFLGKTVEEVKADLKAAEKCRLPNPRGSDGDRNMFRSLGQ